MSNLLQYKIHPYIGSPKVSPLQHCGPVPTVTPKTLTLKVGAYVLWAAAFRHTTAFCSLPRFPVLIVGMGTASSVTLILSFIFNASTRCSFSFMRVAEPSCVRRCLKCSG